MNANHLADQANPLVNPVHLNSQQVSEHEGILTMLVGFLALANGNHLTCSGLVYDSEDTPSGWATGIDWAECEIFDSCL